MSNEKSELEVKLIDIKSKIAELNSELKSGEQTLNDLNKPLIIDSQFEEIESAIHDTVREALESMECNTNYEPELELNGNEINVYSIDFHSVEEVCEKIADAVSDKFRFVDDINDFIKLSTERNNNTTTGALAEDAGTSF